MQEQFEKFYLCQKCGKNSKNYASKQSFFAHSCFGTTVNCEFCSNSFSSKKVLFVHTTSVHQKNKLSCSHCEKEFSSLSSLTKHKKIHREDKLFSCEKCTKKFSSFQCV